MVKVTLLGITLNVLDAISKGLWAVEL